MVNTVHTHELAPISILVRAYLVVALATVAVLAVLSAVAPGQAPQEAWVHAVIVAVFAVVLSLRTRSAARGGPGALRAVGLISAVLLVANVVTALVPGAFPGWMRIEMIGIAALMGAVTLLVARRRRSDRAR